MDNVIDLDRARKQKEMKKFRVFTEKGLGNLERFFDFFKEIEDIPHVAEHKKAGRTLIGTCSLDNNVFEVKKIFEERGYSDVHVGKVFGVDLDYKKDESVDRSIEYPKGIVDLERYGLKGIYGIAQKEKGMKENLFFPRIRKGQLIF